MDSVTLVENQIDDGRRLLDRLDWAGVPVVASGWAKVTDDDRWSLYIATPLVDEKGLVAAYREVYRVLRSLGGVWVSDSEVKLVGERHPVAVDLVALVQKYPGPLATNSRRPLLGGVPVDEVYVYPPKRRPDPRSDLGRRRLKTPVRQQLRPADLTAQYTPKEQHAYAQLLSSGMAEDEARQWIRERRVQEQPRPPIPAGAVVEASYAAWWGDKPEDDPNPLLQVEAGDGAQGLTFLTNTEPVQN